MLVEAGIICFLSYWITSEYVYSSLFRAYADQVILVYSPVFGLALGLTGSVAAIFLVRNLRIARHKLETVAAPKIRVAVDKIVSNMPTSGVSSPLKVGTEQATLESHGQDSSSPVPATASLPETSGKVESKKESS